MVRKAQLPVIGGIRKVITVPGSNVAVGTTIAEIGSGTISLATLATIITNIQGQQNNDGGGNIGDGTEATLVVGPGLSGGGPMLGSVPLRLTAPIPWGMGDDGGGGDGDIGPPGLAGIRGVDGATGGVGPAGPAIFMAADDGQDGDSIPGVTGPAGSPGVAGPTGPAGTTLVYVNTTIPSGNTVANTSVETFFASSYTVLANSLALGTVLRVKFFGVYSTGVVAPSLTLRVYFGATVLITSGTLTTVANITNDGWSAEGLFTVQGVGSSGTIEAQGLSEFSTASTVVLFVNMDNAAPITVDTTINEALRASIQWGGTVNASDTITLREMTVEVMTVAGVPVSLPPIPPFIFFGDDGEEGSIGPPGIPGIAGTGGGNSVKAPVTIPGIVIWFDASILAAAAGGNIPVVGSPDQTRAPMVGFSAASGGTVSATPLNSLPVLTMSGTAGTAYTLNNPQFALGLASTIFAVYKGSSFAGQPIVVSGSSGSLALFVDTTGHLKLNNAGVAGIATSTGTISVGVWAQFNSSYLTATGAWAFRIGRAADSSGISSGTPSSPVTTLFDFGGGGEVLTGDIAEVIAYNRVLTLTEIQTIEAYLFAKWGV